MAEIRDYSTNPDPNTAARWPEGMAMSSVNDTGRVDEGIIARWYRDTRGDLLSTGSADAYVLATSRTFTGGYNGLELVFEANFTNTGPATLEVTGGVVATAILSNSGGALTGGEIQSGAKVTVIHDGTNWTLTSPDSSFIPSDRTTARSRETQATLAGHLFDVTDPDYGAVGDGVTDDTAAIDAAISAAIVNGGVVYFPPGSYLVTTPFTAAVNVDGVTLCGAGRDASQIVIGAAMAALWDFSGGTGDLNRHIGIMHLGFTNPGRTFDADLFSMSRCANWSVDQCYFEEIKGKVFGAEQWFDSVIMDCVFQDCGDTGDPAVYMQNRDTGDAGSGCNNIHFHACQFEANRGAEHVQLTQSARGNRFIDCKFHGELPTPEDFDSVLIDGQSLTDGGTGNAFIGCHFAQGGDNHVKITGAAHANVFMGCRINRAGAVSTGDAGIFIEEGDRTVIQGNIFDGDSQASYGVNAEIADGTIIIGNSFEAHITASIRATGSATNTVRHSNVSLDTQIFGGSNRHDQLAFVNETNNRARVLVFQQGAAVPANNDGASLGYILKDSGGDLTLGAAEIQAVSLDVTAGAEDAEWRFLTMINGSSGQNRFQVHETAMVVDGITEPATRTGWAGVYVDIADGSLKVKFGSGTVKVLATDP